jgi:hypothetical protein
MNIVRLAVARRLLNTAPLTSYCIVRQIMSDTTAATPVGEMNLAKLLTSMDPELDPELYVFCCLPVLPSNVSEMKPRMIFQESEGFTLILTQQNAQVHSLDYNYPCRRIVLNVHSSLDAVGFLARITTHLASRHNERKPISVNPVSAYHHDHLFIPEDRANDAMERLYELIKEESEK